MLNFSQTKFFTTVAKLADLPKNSLAEIAFAGRSNAGKSSAINTLTNQTRLAYVSKTPGRTQNLNYFVIPENNQNTKNAQNAQNVQNEENNLCKFLVDLPGYGYAKAPLEIRKQWDNLIAPYLLNSPSLKALVAIMDIRHPLTTLDSQLLCWFCQTQKPVHIVLTKADKLSRQQQNKTLAEVEKAVTELLSQNGLQNAKDKFSLQIFSSLKKIGKDVLKNKLAEFLNVE